MDVVEPVTTPSCRVSRGATTLASLSAAAQLAKLGVERAMVPAFFFAGPDGMERLAAFGEQVVKPHA
jgi:hypothetical protein